LSPGGVGFRPRWKSFEFAWSGLAHAVRERNFRFHLCALSGVVVLGCVLEIERWEWCTVLLASGLVLSMEAMNSALERLADAVTLERHPLVGAAKDLAAGAVLVATLAAIAVGALVFGPPVLRHLGAI
jgi:diacylglycerol kinase